GSRPHADAHGAVGQRDLRATDLVEPRSGQQQRRLSARGEDLPGGVVADAPRPVSGNAIALDHGRVESLTSERLHGVAPELYKAQLAHEPASTARSLRSPAAMLWPRQRYPITPSATPRSETGERRATQATAPIVKAAPNPPAHARVGSVIAQCLVVAYTAVDATPSPPQTD